MDWSEIEDEKKFKIAIRLIRERTKIILSKGQVVPLKFQSGSTWIEFGINKDYYDSQFIVLSGTIEAIKDLKEFIGELEKMINAGGQGISTPAFIIELRKKKDQLTERFKSLESQLRNMCEDLGRHEEKKVRENGSINSKIGEAIIEGEIIEAISSISDLCIKTEEDQTTLRTIHANFVSLEKENIRGVIAEQSYRFERQRIVARLLEFLEKLDCDGEESDQAV